jgi:hypothetical protein
MDISKGYQFSGTSPNNSVTAEKLNTLVDGATILTAFYTEKAESTAAAADDLALVWDSASHTYKKIRVANFVTAARGRPGATNLKILPNAAAPASKVDVTADYVLMRRASNGNLHLAVSFNATADLGLGVAVNGLDAGTEAANTWYFVHAISDGLNDRLLLSTSASSPTLPSPYVYSCLLGARRNDNLSNLRRDQQHGNEVALEWNTDAGTADVKLLNPKTGATPIDFTNVAPDANGTLQTANLAQCIPDGIAARVQGILGLTSALGNAAVIRRIGLASTTAGSTLASLGVSTDVHLAVLNGAVVADVSGASMQTVTPLAGFTALSRFDLLVKDDHQIAWASLTGSGVAGILSMRVTGYSLALH